LSHLVDKVVVYKMESVWMKAFLLAAGYGTRLKPLTDTIPKCMAPISGKPLLSWWMELFEKHAISEVLVNTHYLPEPVRKYMVQYNACHTATHIVEFFEPELLGSGGTVLANKEFVKNAADFLICYADNLTNVNLSDIIRFHRQKSALLTMGLFHTNNPCGCGIVAMDHNGVICEFQEKPKHPKSNLANAGIYVCSKEIFTYFPHQHVIDFGTDVLPLLAGKMYGYEITGYLRDIGTPENYALVQKEWKS